MAKTEKADARRKSSQVKDEVSLGHAAAALATDSKSLSTVSAVVFALIGAREYPPLISIFGLARY